jgi:hypothetical protein
VPVGLEVFMCRLGFDKGCLYVCKVSGLSSNVWGTNCDLMGYKMRNSRVFGLCGASLWRDA